LNISEKDIARLASFPEQNPNPVLEVSVDGQLTYFNAASKKYFNDIETKGVEHPIFSALWRILKESPAISLDNYLNEISVGEFVFEQKVYKCPVTGIIRLYCSDITERKKMEKQLANLELFN
jgi:hypothetical protein